MEKQSNKKLKKISKELFKASKMHKGQAERIKSLLKKGGYNKLYQVGGAMYGNTIPAGLTTTNLVAEESNPDVLRAKQQQFEEEQLNLTNLSTGASDKIEQDEIDAEQIVEQTAAQSEGQADAIVRGTKQMADKFVKTENRINPLSDAITAYRGVRAVNLASKAQEGITAGVQTAKQAAQGAKALELASKTSKIPATIAAPQTVGTLAEGAKGASAIGAGLKNFATSGAGIGTIASLAGAGISRAADDDDATTMTFGEGTGKVLSGIGTGLGAAALTGAALGSAVPVIGNIIGGAAGAIYGLTKGLVARNKARREERKLQRERDKYVSATNKKIGTRLGAQMANVRAGELKQKTFSGYDQGFNVAARMGGMRLGMPRY